MKYIYNLIGANSNIAKYLFNELKNKGFEVNKFTHSDENMFENFKKNSTNSHINIYFSIIRDDIDSSINHLKKYLNISVKNNSKFFYISSINARFPKCSNYSKIKSECEKIVIEKNCNIIRLGLVISESPFGPYKSIKNLSNLPINFVFSKESKIFTTDIGDFLAFNFNNTHETISEIFSNKYYLNEFIKKNQIKKRSLNINLVFLIKILVFINKFIFLKGILGRLLTLTCIKDEKRII